MQDGSEVLGASNEWEDAGIFTRTALDVVGRVLQLTDEVPYRLM